MSSPKAWRPLRQQSQTFCYIFTDKTTSTSSDWDTELLFLVLSTLGWQYSNQMSVQYVVLCGFSDQLVVQTEGAVVLLCVRACIQGGGQCQREGVSVGELPGTRSDVRLQTWDVRGWRGGGGGRRRGGGFGNRPGVPVGEKTIWGCRRELVSGWLSWSAGQWSSLQPTVRGCPGGVGAVGRRGRGEITQRRGKGEGFVFVMRCCLERKNSWQFSLRWHLTTGNQRSSSQ